MSEWCGHAPILEEDIAMSNIALDLIGQARILLGYAGEVDGKGKSEDDMAFYRDARQFRNLLIAELPNGDFAMTVARKYLLSVYSFYLYQSLTSSKDASIAAFAAKSVKEVAYHVRHFGDWVIRLGDGTEESQERIQNAVNELWNYVDDMFVMDETDQMMVQAGIGADLTSVREKWNAAVSALFAEAGLKTPQANNFLRVGSRNGNHTEHLGYILAEMQFLPRAYPDARW
jgi:ring-1,2-phenylacetyl-CoA epoxidase subunit PaaC